jgi:hypothetical protein
MNDQLAACTACFGHLNLREKREQLHVLSDVVWDIETELAQAKAERAALMDSLQDDLRRGLSETDYPSPERGAGRHAVAGAR